MNASSHPVVARGSALPSAARLFERLPRPLRRHRLMRWWMRLTGEDPLQLVRIRGNAFGYADMNDGFLRLIVIDGDFERDFFRIADALLASGGQFVDVGANHGLLSLGLAATHRERVRFDLFEPNPTLLAAIKRSVALYPGMRCVVNDAAVSSTEGTLRFFVDVAQTGASHIDPAGPLEVRAVTLDAYLARERIAHVDLLKLDVEGYELTALGGARESLARKAIRAIYFEYFEKWLSRVAPPSRVIELLDELGYSVCFCRMHDLAQYGGPTHTIHAGLPGAGLPLRPVAGHRLPSMTDLLAVPAADLTPVA